MVQHTILLDKLLDRNRSPTYWLIIKELYNGLTTKVKWLGSFSESFALKQGVRQGGVLSTPLYKIFDEDLILELEEKSLGFMLGDIHTQLQKKPISHFSGKFLKTELRNENICIP